jgi:hypothetical protein
MNIDRVHVRRAARGTDPEAWARALRGPLAGRALKSDGPAWVRRCTLLGRDVVVKCRPHGAREGLKRLFGRTRGDRHWRGAEWLVSRGFHTAEPILLADALVDHIPSELLITEFVDAPSLLDLLAAHPSRLGVKQEHEVARAVARLVHAMLLEGRYNRDGKPSNLLIAPTLDGEGGAFRVIVLDCVAIRRGRSFRVYKRSLVNLLLEPMGTGCMPRLALCARVVHELVGPPPLDPQERSSRWVDRAYSWYKVKEYIEAHGDPTPRVSPLGP